jgi:hypothetical protein
MSTTRTRKGIVQSVVAATIGAVGFLPIAPLAQAYPFDSGCDKYAFNGEFRARGSNWTVRFNSTGEHARGPAVVRFDDGGQVSGGIITGRILGTAINFDILWHDKPNNVWRFTGNIRDGRAQGSQSTSFSGQGTNWFSETSLACAMPPPAPAGPVPGLH